MRACAESSTVLACERVLAVTRRIGPKNQPRMNSRCDPMLATTPPPASSFWKNQPFFALNTSLT